MKADRFYLTSPIKISRYVNHIDILLLFAILAILFILSKTAQDMTRPYELGTAISISLSPAALPGYALQTVMRMFIALFFSLLFTFIVGACAAKNRRAEQLIIPAVDILQSIPVLSFLSITVTAFIQLFPNSMMGPQCASIFAIFTSQVWNMVFSFYQSLKMMPHDLKEVSAMLRLSPWYRFWKIEVPFSMPSLLWNMMMSMSASWFFVVLSEAILVSHQQILLPGIGSYIATAIAKSDLIAVGYAIMTMIIVIFFYDQILFRPLITWSEKFKSELSPDLEEYQSWLVDMVRQSRLVKHIGSYLAVIKTHVINPRWLMTYQTTPCIEPSQTEAKQHQWLWFTIIVIALTGGFAFFFHFIFTALSSADLLHVFFLGAATGSRVIILIILSSLLWIPVGVFVGLRPRLSQRIQPIIQFAAAFPANLFYPIFVILIVAFQLNVQIWLTPLMILGTQWYILFNVIAGASNIPVDLTLAADNFGLKGLLWWKRLALPAIFPYYITGAITAAGGAWNASIVAEWVSWGSTTLHATGLGEYIQANTIAGNFPKIALGTAMMCFYVLTFNHLIWRPLYRLAQERFNIN